MVNKKCAYTPIVHNFPPAKFAIRYIYISIYI